MKRTLKVALLQMRQEAQESPLTTTIMRASDLTDLCAHAFKVKNHPFWAVQFQPEWNKAILTERLGIYKSLYTRNELHFQEVASNAVSTPHAHRLLLEFVKTLFSLVELKHVQLDSHLKYIILREI